MLLGDLGGLDLGLNLSLGGLLLGGLLLGHADKDGDRGADLAVEVDLDLVLAGGLDGVAAADALAVDLDAELGLDGLGDLGGGDGAKELALLADLGVNGDGLAIDGGLQSLGSGDALGLALWPLSFPFPDAR